MMKDNSGDDVQHYKQQLKFQELLLLLFERNYPSGQLPSPAESVERTVEYMQKHYMESITVKQLAELAGIPLWQYTPLFQKLTGTKPLNYLTELRIHHSKRFLLDSAEPLREVARQVGFSDEYYFSRRFRQKTGVTPDNTPIRSAGSRRSRIGRAIRWRSPNGHDALSITEKRWAICSRWA